MAMSTPAVQSASSPQVWYAAYGSNLAEDRFLCYIRGGRPCGGKHRLAGCRDKTPPAQSRSHQLPLRLFIGGRSQTWDGHGVAFVGTRRRPDQTTWVRIWLVRTSQLEDVVAQENGLRAGRVSIDPAALSRDHHWDVGVKGKYPRIIRLGAIDGRPVLTCTTANGSLQGRPRPPAPDYLRWMAKGLRELSWTETRISEYLFGIRGVNRGFADVDAVREVITSPPCVGQRTTFPYVETLTYGLELPDPSFRISPDAKAADGTLGDFIYRLDQSQLTCRPTTHFASIRTAQAALEPLLGDWEAEFELLQSRQIRFEFLGAQLIREPPKPGLTQLSGYGVAHSSGSATVVVTAAAYPAGPSGRIRNTLLVERMRARLSDVRQGTEKVPGAAYWLVTELEKHFGKATAPNAMNVSAEVLRKVRRLSSQEHPRHGRKAGPPGGQTLTDADLQWLRRAIEKLVLRAAETDAAAPDRSLLTLGDFR
jgi:hypothetical protein